MKEIFKKASTYERVIAIGLVLVVGTAGVVYALGRDDDDDSDGVANSGDMCPNTVPDQSSDWGTNRYLWFGGDSMSFILLGPDGSKAPSEFDSMQTKGCSCFDILRTRNSSDSAGQYKSGCSKGTLEEWIKKANK